MKQSTEEKIKSVMKRLSALVEQYYKEHNDGEKGLTLRHYASYVHGISYFEDSGCSTVTDCLILNDDASRRRIDITHDEKGRELFDNMTKED